MDAEAGGTPEPEAGGNENPNGGTKESTPSRGAVGTTRRKRASARGKPRAWEDRWIEAFRKYRKVSMACRATRMGRRTVYTRREESPEFAERWQDVLDERFELLEESSWQRATDGHEIPIYQEGFKVGVRVEFETALTIFMLKAHGGEKYRFDEIGRGKAASELAKAVTDALQAMDSSVPAEPEVPAVVA